MLPSKKSPQALPRMVTRAAANVLVLPAIPSRGSDSSAQPPPTTRRSARRLASA